MPGGWESALGGGISDFINSAYTQYMAQDRQEDMQSYNAEQSAIDRGWRQQMRATQYQTMVEDMKLAGLNPMLAISKGASDTPGSGAASAGTASPGGGHSIAAGMQSASQAALNATAIDRTVAETDKIRAEEAEIKARTPTHAQSIEVMQQNIRESGERIQRIMQEVRTGGATEANLRQQTTNLQEIIPQIRATIENIKQQTAFSKGPATVLAGAQSAASIAQAGLHGEQQGEVRQRVSENLPALEAALMKLEKVQQDMRTPQMAMDESVHDSFIGALSATMRALIPFNAIVPTVPIRGTGAAAPSRDTRRDWKK